MKKIIGLLLFSALIFAIFYYYKLNKVYDLTYNWQKDESYSINLITDLTTNIQNLKSIATFSKPNEITTITQTDSFILKTNAINNTELINVNNPQKQPLQLTLTKTAVLTLTQKNIFILQTTEKKVKLNEEWQYNIQTAYICDTNLPITAKIINVSNDIAEIKLNSNAKFNANYIDSITSTEINGTGKALFDLKNKKLLQINFELKANTDFLVNNELYKKSATILKIQQFIVANNQTKISS